MIFILIIFLVALIVSIYLIEKFFSEHSKINFIPKNKLDIPLDNGNILILSRPGCIFCYKLMEYIENNKDNIKHKLIIVTYNQSGLDFNDEYTDLPETEKRKINDIIEYNKQNPMFGFPTMYKKDIIQPGFAEEKMAQFFEI